MINRIYKVTVIIFLIFICGLLWEIRVQQNVTIDHVGNVKELENELDYKNRFIENIINDHESDAIRARVKTNKDGN